MSGEPTSAAGGVEGTASDAATSTGELGKLLGGTVGSVLPNNFEKKPCGSGVGIFAASAAAAATTRVALAASTAATAAAAISSAGAPPRSTIALAASSFPCASVKSSVPWLAASTAACAASRASLAAAVAADNALCSALFASSPG
jgi:hypothetical protein